MTAAARREDPTERSEAVKIMIRKRGYGYRFKVKCPCEHVVQVSPVPIAGTWTTFRKTHDQAIMAAWTHIRVWHR